MSLNEGWILLQFLFGLLGYAWHIFVGEKEEGWIK